MIRGHFVGLIMGHRLLVRCYDDWFDGISLMMVVDCKSLHDTLRGVGKWHSDQMLMFRFSLIHLKAWVIDLFNNNCLPFNPNRVGTIINTLYSSIVLNDAELHYLCSCSNENGSHDLWSFITHFYLARFQFGLSAFDSTPRRCKKESTVCQEVRRKRPWRTTLLHIEKGWDDTSHCLRIIAKEVVTTELFICYPERRGSIIDVAAV